MEGSIRDSDRYIVRSLDSFFAQARIQAYCLKNRNKDKVDSSAGNSLSLYSEIIRFETYHKLVKNINQRVAVTKMRISCHLVRNETGRYKKYLELRDFVPSASLPLLVACVAIDFGVRGIFRFLGARKLGQAQH